MLTSAHAGRRSVWIDQLCGILYGPTAGRKHGYMSKTGDFAKGAAAIPDKTSERGAGSARPALWGQVGRLKEQGDGF